MRVLGGLQFIFGGIWSLVPGMVVLGVAGDGNCVESIVELGLEWEE